MAKLFLVYGIPKGKTERHEEVLLLSKGQSEADQNKVIAAAGKDGFHGFRKATHTDGDAVDFGSNSVKKIRWT